jgi:hypothetical protein
MPALTPEQDQGVEEALAALYRGKGADLDDVAPRPNSIRSSEWSQSN